MSVCGIFESLWQGNNRRADLLVKIVTLTDSQIKALPTTPVTLVPAPAAGRRNKVLAGTVSVNNAAGLYTNLNASYAALYVTASGSTNWEAALERDSTVPHATNLATLLTTAAGAARFADLLVPYANALDSGGAVGTYEYVQPGVIPSVEYDATALVVGIDNNGSGALTGGHASNTLKVTVYYAVEAL